MEQVNINLLDELTCSNLPELAKNVQKWNLKGGAPTVLIIFWDNLTNSQKTVFAQFVKSSNESSIESNNFYAYDTGVFDELPKCSREERDKYILLDVPDSQTMVYEELWTRVNENSRDVDYTLANILGIESKLHALIARDCSNKL